LRELSLQLLDRGLHRLLLLIFLELHGSRELDRRLIRLPVPEEGVHDAPAAIAH
jgi:hypothetical protein